MAQAQQISSISLREFSSPPPAGNSISVGWFPTFHHQAFNVKPHVLQNMLMKVPTTQDPNPNIESFRKQLYYSISELLNVTNIYDTTKNADKRSRTVNSLWILFGQVDRVMRQNPKRPITLWYSYMLLDATDRSAWWPFFVECKKVTPTGTTLTTWEMSFSILEPSLALRTMSTHSSVSVGMELALLVSFVFRNITRELEMRALLVPRPRMSWELKAMRDMYNAYKHENMHEDAHRAILSTMCNLLLNLLAQAQHNNASLVVNRTPGTWASLLDPIQNAHWSAIKLLVNERMYTFHDEYNWMICASISMRDKQVRKQELVNGIKNPMHSAKWNYKLQNISNGVADLRDILHFTGEWASNNYAIF